MSKCLRKFSRKILRKEYVRHYVQWIGHFLYMSKRPLVGQDLLIMETLSSYTPYSVGLLWTTVQPDAENFTLYNTYRQEIDSHDAGGIRTPNSSKQAATDQPLRRRDHWDRHAWVILSECFRNWEGVNWIQVAQDNTIIGSCEHVKNPRVCMKGSDCMTTWHTIRT
jgi:hypothetical protein